MKCDSDVQKVYAFNFAIVSVRNIFRCNKYSMRYAEDVGIICVGLDVKCRFILECQ